MSIKLVIFDLDGTLVDTREDITNSLNHAVKPFGLAPLSMEKTTSLIGEGLTRLVEKALGSEKAAHKEEIMDRFIEHYSAHLVDSSRLYPRVRETLEQLGGLKKAVLSNKRESLSTRLLRELGIADHFDLIAGSDTTPEKKPSPAAVTYVLKALGVGPAEAVIVGDSKYDMAAGKGAGVLTVAVTYGYMSGRMLDEADLRIDSMMELVPALYGFSKLPEKRSEPRHKVPDVLRKYIELHVKIGDEFIPAPLVDFSEHGLKFLCPVPLDPGTSRQCLLSVPRSLKREISLTVGIKHCGEEGGTYLVGAMIESVDSELWFKVFKNILKFIYEREGKVF